MLHMVRGDQLRLVLRNKQQVEAALEEYHNELNHLDVSKCLRLLNERCRVSLSPCFYQHHASLIRVWTVMVLTWTNTFV